MLFCACLWVCWGDQSPEFSSLVVWGRKLTSRSNIRLFSVRFDLQCGLAYELGFGLYSCVGYAVVF